MEAMTSDREAFEKWAESQYPQGIAVSSGTQMHINNAKERAWEIWQASRAHLTQPAQAVDVGAPSIEAAEAMGAKGGPAVEAERLAFEAWMRGHCWSLGATWDGTGYRSDAEQGGRVCPHAMQTRSVWAAWRDRAALARALSAEKAGWRVPDQNWFADQLCDLRNKWAEGCEPGWLETDDNHPDDWMAKELRKRMLAAAPSAPEGDGGEDHV